MSRIRTLAAEDGVAQVIMSGDGTNPLDLELVDELIETLRDLDNTRSCRAIVLASDDRHFCAGATSKFAPGTKTWSTADLYSRVPELYAFDMPIVVALNGATVGGGLGLALLGDWRQIASDGRVQVNFSLLGYTPGFGTTLLLPELIGFHRSDDLILSGRPVGAAEAVSIGLVDASSSPDDLRSDAIERAQIFAAAAPLAVRAIKARQRARVRSLLTVVLDDELRLQEELKQTADYAEGMAAMRERRTPRFLGQ